MRLSMPDVSWKVRLIRSPRRKASVAARLVGDTVEVRVPEGLSPDRERELVDRLVSRIQSRIAGAAARNDDDLMRRAQEINRRYFAGALGITSVRFVGNQSSRYGSCSPDTAVIRLSDRLARMPDWVLDYVLVHELAHLLEPNHSPAFWKLVRRYKLAERAIGYLMAAGLEEEPDQA